MSSERAAVETRPVVAQKAIFAARLDQRANQEVRQVRPLLAGTDTTAMVCRYLSLLFGFGARK